MDTPKSQTVRLKEEIVRALTKFSSARGFSQQHIVSVGAWFYMCMPSNLREGLTESFYEWCKSRFEDPRIPSNSKDFVLSVVKAIETECDKQAAKFETDDIDIEELFSDPETNQYMEDRRSGRSADTHGDQKAKPVTPKRKKRRAKR